jgi:hypothetical protein
MPPSADASEAGTWLLAWSIRDKFKILDLLDQFEDKSLFSLGFPKRTILSVGWKLADYVLLKQPLHDAPSGRAGKCEI